MDTQKTLWASIQIGNPVAFKTESKPWHLLDDAKLTDVWMAFTFCPVFLLRMFCWKSSRYTTAICVEKSEKFSASSALLPANLPVFPRCSHSISAISPMQPDMASGKRLPRKKGKKCDCYLDSFETPKAETSMIDKHPKRLEIYCSEFLIYYFWLCVHM